MTALTLSPEQGLSRYLSDIRKFPMLDKEQEFMLAKRWREHGDPEAAGKYGKISLTAGGENRHGLSWLWLAARRGNFRG